MANLKLSARNASSLYKLGYYGMTQLQDKYGISANSEGLRAFLKYEGIKEIVIELDDIGCYQNSYVVPAKVLKPLAQSVQSRLVQDLI
jgi:hypothetical protein